MPSRSGERRAKTGDNLVYSHRFSCRIGTVEGSASCLLADIYLSKSLLATDRRRLVHCGELWDILGGRASDTLRISPDFMLLAFCASCTARRRVSFSRSVPNEFSINVLASYA